MNKLTSCLLLIFLGMNTLFGQIQTDKLSSSLFEAYQEASAEEHLPVFLLLSDRLDIQAMSNDLDRRKAGLKERAYTVITSLQEKAQTTQAPLIQYLQNHPGAKEESIRGVWIANIVFAEVQPALLETLTQDGRVAFIELDHPLELIAEVQDRSFIGPMNIPNGIEPGIAAIDAPELWAMGYTGYGRKALIIDTGVDTRHQALWNHYYGHYVPDNQAWTGFGERPFDCEDHGTDVAGAVLGVDRERNDTIGVAFNGLWMAAPPIGCGWVNSGINAFETMQWAINPDNNPNTIDDMPDVINNSWGSFGGGDECFSGWPDMLIAVEAAGIANIFAAGNEGPDESTLRSPQNVNTNLISCFTVGALVGSNDAFPIADFSSRGPSLCDGTGALKIKPEVSAPGVSVRSCVPGGLYDNFSGTSMASPHVAGAAMLLKEAFPDVPGKEIMFAMYYSAIDLGEPGEDNVYGRGIINVPAAYQYLIDEGFDPTPPANRQRDAMILDVQTTPVACEDLMDIAIRFENAGDDTLQNLEVLYQFDDPANTSGSFNWDGSLELGEQAEILFEDLNTPSEGTYILTVTLANPNGVQDDRPMNNQIRQRVYLVDEVPMEATFGIDGAATFCADQPAILKALPNAAGRVEWYDDSQEGDLLGEGVVLLTDTLTENTTFYADFIFEKDFGLPFDEDAQTFDQEPEEGLVFDVFHPIEIKTVNVQVEEVGARIIKVLNSDGNTIKQRIVNFTEIGMTNVELKFKVNPGEDYRLVADLGKPFSVATALNTYPIEIPGILSITSGTTVPFNYYYFFDWEIEYYHPCGRTPVEVEISSSDDAPMAAFTASTTILDITNGTAPINFTDESTDAISWSWDFGDGNLSSMQNPAHTYTETGIYDVILLVTNADGCSNATTTQIEVFEEITVSAQEIQNTIDVQFYPNPVSQIGQLSIEVPNNISGQFQLFNLMGQQVRQAEFFQGTWNTSISFQQLPKGVYLLQVQTEIGTKPLKLFTDRLDILRLI